MSATRRQTRRPRAGRPPRFERDELIAAALEVGPDHLALRDVSVVLGAPPTTIYNHVRSSDELGRLVLASLLATEPATSWPLGDEHPWPTLLADFAVRTRAALFAAGSWLKYWTPGIAAAPVRRADRLIARLVGDGFTVEAAGHALALVHAVVQDSVSYHAYVAGNARGRRRDAARRPRRRGVPMDRGRRQARRSRPRRGALPPQPRLRDRRHPRRLRAEPHRLITSWPVALIRRLA